MQKYFNNVTNRTGDVVPGAIVTVTLAATGALATIYSDDGVTTRANPITADNSGYFEFYAADGLYDLAITGSGIQALTISDVLIEDLSDLTGGEGASLVGYTPAGTGAVARTVQAKLRETISLYDFGGVGNGVADDTAAMDAAAARVTAASGKLVIPPGTWNHSGPWTLTGSNFIVEGCGESSVIVNTNTTTNLSKTMEVTGDKFILRDFKIDGKKATLNAAGLTERSGLVASGNYFLIDNVVAVETLTHGILAGFGRVARLRDCVARDVGYFGGNQNALGITVSSATQASVVGCHAYNTARTGIFVYLSEAVAVTGNSVDSCENGIRVDVGGNHRSIIAGNVACRGTGDGIRFTGSNVTVSGNSCFANGGSGLNSEGGTEQTVTGNTAIGNAQNGLRVGSAVGATSRLTVTGNTLTGNTGNGIYLTPSTSSATDVLISGNNLLGNSDRALRLGAAGAASTVVIGDNNVAASGTDSMALSATNWTANSPGNYRGTIASASTITVFGKGTYGISGTADITNITVQPQGTEITLYFVANAAGTGLADGTGNLRLNGNFVYAANSAIKLVCAGTTWLEVSRSIN